MPVFKLQKAAIGGILWNYSGAAQALTQNTYNKVINATANLDTAQIVVSDYANTQIIVPVTGLYKCFANFSASVSTAAVVLHTAFFAGEVEQEIESERYISSANDVGAWSLSGPLQLSANDILTIRMNPDKNTNLSLNHGQFWVEHV